MNIIGMALLITVLAILYGSLSKGAEIDEKIYTDAYWEEMKE